MRKKEKENSLKKPSLLRRVWKVWLYNAFWSIVFFGLFFGLFSIDVLAFELDYFMMYGMAKLRYNLIFVCLSFWFMFRQFFKIMNLIKFTYLTAQHDKEIIEKGGAKRLYDGEEGVGKTINTAFDTLMIGASKDRAMRLEYYLKHPYSSMLKNDVDFKVLKESFEYFQDHKDRIPHVMADFDIIYNKQKNYPFSMEYIDQVKRIAHGFSCGLTELAIHLPNSWSRIPADEKKDVHKCRIKNESLSLSRQWYDLTITADEQRCGEVFLGFRSVVSRAMSITARKKVLKPCFLDRYLKRLENRVLRRKKKTSRLLSWWYCKLRDISQDIGFYFFTYNLIDAQTGAVLESDLSFVTSCDIPFWFDTTGQRHNYKLYRQSPE